jgi:hypothetical protein
VIKKRGGTPSEKDAAILEFALAEPKKNILALSLKKRAHSWKNAGT